LPDAVVSRWHPVTHDYGLIRAPLRDVVRELLAWHDSIDIHYAQRQVTAGFSAALDALAPLSQSKRRRLFVATPSEWVACFQSGIQGSDPFPAMSFLAKRMNVLGMRVCCTSPDATWPGAIWEVYAPESLGGRGPSGYRRSICALNDGGRWDFHQSGEPYPFEVLSAYAKRRRRDRFTREMLIDYVAHFGVRPFADDFFVVNEETPALLLERASHARETREFSLDEVVSGKPWSRVEEPRRRS
jgi:hypothetical protein